MRPSARPAQFTFLADPQLVGCVLLPTRAPLQMLRPALPIVVVR